LIEDLAQFHDYPVLWRFWAIPFLLDGHANAQSVSDEDWLDETKTIITVADRLRIHFSRCHTDRYTEDECTVRNALAERLGLTPLRVHVVWVKVTRLASMNHNVCFRNGST
jgi:hypothetical protein